MKTKKNNRKPAVHRVGYEALLAVWMVYDNQFGNVDSIWSDEAGANIAAKKANNLSKELYGGRYFYIVREEPLMHSANTKDEPRPAQQN